VVIVPTSLNLGKTGLREYEVSYLPYEDEPGSVTHVVVVTRDMTDKLAAERALVRAKEMAETASLAKSTFLASMGQELRRPLNSIIGLAQMLEMDLKAPLSDAQQASMRQILTEGRHLLTLISEVQDLACMEMGRLELKTGSVQLQPVITEVMAEMETEAQRLGVFLVYSDGDQGSCPRVRADASRLRQVMRNLLANALHSNRPQGCVVVSCDTRGEWVRVTVADTGPGIPEVVRGRVFQPFQRLGRAHTGSDGGGIGPVYGKRLVEAMHGRMGYDSEVCVGSFFWFELREAADAEPAIPASPPPVASGQSQNGRVLYVEDSVINLDLMKQVFSLLPGVEQIGRASCRERVS
jgi:signal transduction histidine kinase